MGDVYFLYNPLTKEWDYFVRQESGKVISTGSKEDRKNFENEMQTVYSGFSVHFYQENNVTNHYSAAQDECARI